MPGSSAIQVLPFLRGKHRIMQLTRLACSRGGPGSPVASPRATVPYRFANGVHFQDTASKSTSKGPRTRADGCLLDRSKSSKRSRSITDIPRPPPQHALVDCAGCAPGWRLLSGAGGRETTCARPRSQLFVEEGLGQESAARPLERSRARASTKKRAASGRLRMSSN